MNNILSAGVGTAILVLTALLLLAAIVLLVRWLAARSGDEPDTETSPCPACSGNLVGCSHCATLCEAEALSFPTFDEIKRMRRGG